MKHKNKLLAIILGVLFYLPLATQAAPGDIIFTEIMYDPAGSDTDKEWVEIYNSGSEAVTIVEGSGNNSWRFNDGSNHTLTLVQGSLTIPPAGVAILASDGAAFLADHPGFTGTVIDTVMALNNTTDAIKLSSDKGASFFGEFTYQNTQGGNGDSKSLEKVNGTWQASSVDGGTPGTVTNAPISQSTPVSEQPPPASSSASATTPPPSAIDPKAVKIIEVYPNPAKEDEQEFIELWNSGSQTISLENWKLGDVSKIITLNNITLVANEHRALFGNITKLSLNNTKETVTLYDKDGNLIDTVSWQTSSKGQSYVFDSKQSKWLWTIKPTPGSANELTAVNEPPQARIAFSDNPVAPNEEVIISAAESSDPDDDPLIFNWTIGESFQAFGPNFQYRFPSVGTHIVYLTASDGQHTVTATSAIQVLPAAEILSLRRQRPAVAATATINKTQTSTPTKTTKAQSTPFTPLTPFSSPSLPSDNLVDVNLEDIRELDIGTPVRVQGTVAVEPEVLAKSYFYLVGSPGIQVYFSKSDWPKLTVGDVVGILGILSEANGELRLRVADREDIVPLYKGKSPEATEAETGEIGEELEGSLVKIAGELGRKKGASWFVDDGSGEVKVTFQTAAKIKKPAVRAGEWVEITGLVSETKTGYRVLPRYASDVRVLNEQEIADKAGSVLGESASAAANDAIQRFRIPANNKPQAVLKYLLITSGALILLLAGLLIKLRIETKNRRP